MKKQLDISFNFLDSSCINRLIFFHQWIEHEIWRQIKGFAKIPVLFVKF